MSLEATAHHEAGHAVIARALGLRVDWVTVEPTDSYLGLCRTWVDDEDPASLRPYCISTLAGGFADAKHRGVKWDCFERMAEPENGEDEDLTSFARHVSIYARLTGASPKRAEAILFQECEALVEQHWSEITRLARILTQAGTVEYVAYGKNPRLPMPQTTA